MMEMLNVMIMVALHDRSHLLKLIQSSLNSDNCYCLKLYLNKAEKKSKNVQDLQKEN